MVSPLFKRWLLSQPGTFRGGFLRNAQMLTDTYLLKEECPLPARILGWVKYEVQTENPKETKHFKGEAAAFSYQGQAPSTAP